MDLQTYDKATELLNKYRLCETMLEYLSDPDAVKGQKYLEKSGEFFKVFHDEMLVFMHELQTKCGEEFNDLHCECHTDNGVEPPKEPTLPPEDSEFQIGSRVKIVNAPIAVFNGRIGTVVDYDPIETKFAVQVDGFSADALPQWFAEDEIELYAEPEEENPEYSNGFTIGDRVKVMVQPYVGKLGTVVGFSQYYIRVILDDNDEEELEFADSDIEKITPENPEEPSQSDENEFKRGDYVKVISGEYEGRVGVILTVAMDYSTCLVLLNCLPDDEQNVEMWFPLDMIEPYETPEDDGTGDTDPTEGE